MNMKLTFTIEENETNTRLDVILTHKLASAANDGSIDSSISRSYLQKLFKDGSVLLNNKIVKGNTKPSANAIIEVSIPEPVQLEVVPENIPLDIIYEDNDVLLVNKPKGMVVHPAAGHTSGTLVNALLYHCKDALSGINGVMRPGIVHRIDMNTTGILIVCKNDWAHQSLAMQLKEHTITRKYRAIVHGIIKEDTLTIEGSIGRHPQDRKKMAMNVRNGKHAVTHVKVLERFSKYTYVECELETGRTHQIRVHLASRQHPLLGDSVYGRSREEFSLNGQTLHAMIFGFIHPTTGTYMEFEAPLPDYFTNLLEKLRRQYS